GRTVSSSDPADSTTGASSDGSPADSTSSGGGMCALCPRLADGETDLGQDPRLDGYFRAVLDFRRSVDDAAAVYKASFAALAEAWGYGGPTSPTPAHAAALASYINAQTQASTVSGVVLQLERLRCAADIGVAIDEQARCESELGCDLGLSCPDEPTQADIDVTCEGVCFGACGEACPSLALCPAPEAPGLACGGSCFGVCMVTAQSCLGKCTGECDGQPDFEGLCPDDCTGECALIQGGPCPGTCVGDCLDDAAALTECTETLACIGGCATACEGDCLGNPVLGVAESCGGEPCEVAPECAATSGLRANVATRCDLPAIVPCYSSTLGPTVLLAFEVKVEALEVHAAQILLAHARLSRVVQGAAPRSLVNAPLDPPPAADLVLRISALAERDSGLSVPCPICAEQGLQDALGVMAVALGEAELLIAAGDALRLPLGL
ncbi:MAG: hypothetical protein JKY37_13905, partial [Nannocystaceae bacterium]|nr:hypothetical protein [Nannocystaceae bacterium]